MTTLDFSEREPALGRKKLSEAEVLNGNRAFYERLQGQRTKSGIERFGWVALPIAAVAIIGVVAATSMPHNTSSELAAQNARNTPVSTPAPAALASNSTPAPVIDEPTAAPVKSASVQASPAAAKPAPVKLARRAASSDAVTTAPASAAPVQIAPAAPLAAPAPQPAPVIQAPAAVQAPATTVIQDAAPAAPAQDSAPAPSAPTDAAPAQ